MVEEAYFALTYEPSDRPVALVGHFAKRAMHASAVQLVASPLRNSSNVIAGQPASQHSHRQSG